MDVNLKKVIRVAVYGFIVVVGALIALIPFLKKKEFSTELSTDFSPEVRDVSADAFVDLWGTSDGDDDGGGI
ncbi:MAG: hypothetical protein KC877_01420 [Candidatus Kaiserbacteria bacterium]|nr:hypothetical protein [Candidatus Kaiserbacteria bacterium]MCB9816665.1 hypothetical protein [Candidatus Nomurabacteria bacterium]